MLIRKRQISLCSYTGSTIEALYTYFAGPHHDRDFGKQNYAPSKCAVLGWNLGWLLQTTALYLWLNLQPDPTVLLRKASQLFWPAVASCRYWPPLTLPGFRTEDLAFFKLS